MMDFTMSNIAQLSVRLRRDAASMEHGHAQDDVRAAARILENVADAAKEVTNLKRMLAVLISEVSTKTCLYEMADRISELLSSSATEPQQPQKDTTT